MAFPLIVIAAMSTSALYGAAKTAIGYSDANDAEKTNSQAEAIVIAADRNLELLRNSLNTNLEDYGARKLRAFNGVIEDFIDSFGKLKNVESICTPELDKLKLEDFSTVSFESLKNDYLMLKSSGLGVGAGLGSGAALAFGAYNGTMMLATASTGTAISTLSGAAATNATLAWLGGGSLAAGGGGIAVGTMVLGSILIGPAIAIFGHVVGKKASAALADANSNLEKAMTYQKESDLVQKNLKTITEVVVLANSTFSKTSGKLRGSVSKLKKVIQSQGNDYQAFSEEERGVVLRSVKFAQLLKAMIDAPILDENGNLILASEKRIQEISALVVA